MMTKVQIDSDRCKGCQYCIIYCPKKCIEFSKDFNKHGAQYAEFVNKVACTQCGICAIVCPDACIAVYKDLGDQLYKQMGNKLSDFIDSTKSKKEDES